MIYVASSWRNPMQPAVVKTLEAAGLEVYDFRHPTEDSDGFHWSDVMPSYVRGVATETLVPVAEYLEGIQHPIAEEGFANDFNAMQACDTCVLVLPCGRSAHLELGWFVGQGRKTAILLEPDDVVLPELMYKMVDHISPSLLNLLGWLGVED